MIASEMLLYLQMSLRISPILSALSPLANCRRVSFLNYFINLWFGTVHSLVKWRFGPAGCPSVEIPLPLLEILARDLQFQDNGEDPTTAIQRQQLLKLSNKCC